jgi:hypothetical protein
MIETRAGNDPLPLARDPPEKLSNDSADLIAISGEYFDTKQNSRDG